MLSADRFDGIYNNVNFRKIHAIFSALDSIRQWNSL